MENRKNKNFTTVLKQTMISSLSQPSTIIISVIFLVLICFLLIGIPLIVLTTSDGSSDELVKSMASMIVPNLFYPVCLFITLITISVTTAGLSLSEMTFVLSRPVSRKNYLGGKYFSGIILSLPALIVTIIAFLICNVILKNNLFSTGFKDQFDNIGLGIHYHFNWATMFVTPFLCWLFGVTGPIFFRNVIAKDRLIYLTCMFITIGIFVLWQIILVIIQSTTHDENVIDFVSNPNVAYLLVPGIIYGVGIIFCLPFSFKLFSKYVVKV